MAGRAVLALCALVFLGCHRQELAADPRALGSSFTLSLAAAQVGTADAPVLRALFEEAERLLPPKVKRGIGRPVVIGLDPSRAPEKIVVPACDEARGARAADAKIQTLAVSQLSRHGDVPHRIWLHPDIAAIARSGSEQAARFACGHRSLYRLALATVLHELVHLYDDTARLSQSPVYQHMQQFAESGGLRRLQAQNQLRLRSPDVYEFQDIGENLAVNVEYFLLDPEFKCRRPAVYRELARQLDYWPNSEYRCSVNTLVYAGSQLASLDPSRVYQIHYLFAARGKGIASGFGHSMFRIVACAPSRTRVDEHCLEDLHHHVVLSFIANLRDDLTLSAWKGLSGKYMSQLLIRPLTEILNDYTEIDYRDLQSIPLNMNEQEIAQFIHHTLELYWSYSGKYYFLTNNCADESLRLLQTALTRDEVQELSIVTPRGLRSELLRHRIGDASMMADRESALSRGYLFMSAMRRYEDLFLKFRDTLPAGAPRRLAKYLSGTTAAQRRTFATARLDAPTSLAGMFTLEGLILQRLLKDIERTVLIRILVDRDPRYVELGKQLKAYLAGLSLPWEVVKSGYGIPLPHEFTPETPLKGPEGFPEEILTRALALVKVDDAKLYGEYIQAEQNRKFMLSVLLQSKAAAPEAAR